MRATNMKLVVHIHCSAIPLQCTSEIAALLARDCTIPVYLMLPGNLFIL